MSKEWMLNEEKIDLWIWPLHPTFLIVTLMDLSNKLDTFPIFLLNIFYITPDNI